MTRNLLKRLPGGAPFWILVVVAAAAGCDSSPGTVPPDHWTRSTPPLATLGDERVMAECRMATVSVRARRYLPDIPGLCNDGAWIIDLSVESDAGEAMLLDFLRPYGLYDWEVHAGGGRVRHDLSVIWDPMNDDMMWRASLNGVPPMTIGVCPEGGRGPVLACSDVSCELYDREDQVPEAFAGSLDFTVRSPWGYEDVQDLYEGDTLDIPMAWTAHRDRRWVDGIALTLEGDTTHIGPEELVVNQLEFLSPSRYEFGPLRAGESGTVVFRLRAILNDIEELPGFVEVVPFSRACPTPSRIQVRVLDRR